MYSKFRGFLIFCSLSVCSFLGQKDKNRKFCGFMPKGTLLSLCHSSVFLSKQKVKRDVISSKVGFDKKLRSKELKRKVVGGAFLS